MVHEALRRFKDEGRGVLVFLRDGTVGVPVSELPQNSEPASAAYDHISGARWTGARRF